ncbi:MAG: alpha/beta hydrolase [Desulfobacterales bacterium]|nr:alpha/beta hydrolase [Desulfobacterales bacterium]
MLIRMLRYVALMWILLLSACSSQQVEIKPGISMPEKGDLLPAQHWQFSYFDEPRFNSKVAVLEAGDKHNPPVILIHGLGQLGMKDWFTVIPDLEKNYHVIAIDLPGFGNSSASFLRFLPSHYAEVIAAISKQYINRKAIVIGHSMGGAVALRYSNLYGELVDKLIVVDAAGIIEKSAFIKYIAKFKFGDDLPVFVQNIIDQLNGFSSSMIEAESKPASITHFLQKNDSAWKLLVSDSPNMNAALSLVEEDFSQAVADLTVPVDIIWGEKDTVAPLRTGKVLNKQLTKARLQVIKGAGHMPMQSHHYEFIQALNIALTEPIADKQLQQSEQTSQGDLICNDESNMTYSGRYDSIELRECSNINLVNITSNRLIISDSAVQIENLRLTNKGRSLEINESVVTITNANISGHHSVLINGSRLDMAGVSIKATGDAVMISNGSWISASLSDISSPNYQGVVHGAFYLKHQPLISE